MGIDYHAILAIGCRIPRAKLYRKHTARSCSHAGVRSGVNFCPECGKKAYIEEHVPIPEYDEQHSKLNDVPVVHIWHDPDSVIVSPVKREIKSYDGPSSAMLAVPDFDEIRGVVEKALKPLGFFDSATFGIWLVQNIG